MQPYLPSQGWGNWLGTSLILTAVDYPFRCSVQWFKSTENSEEKLQHVFFVSQDKPLPFTVQAWHRLRQKSTVRLQAAGVQQEVSTLWSSTGTFRGLKEQFQITLAGIFFFIPLFPLHSHCWKMKLGDSNFFLCLWFFGKIALTLSVWQILRNDLVAETFP